MGTRGSYALTAALCGIAAIATRILASDAAVWPWALVAGTVFVLLLVDGLLLEFYLVQLRMCIESVPSFRTAFFTGLSWNRAREIVRQCDELKRLVLSHFDLYPRSLAVLATGGIEEARKYIREEKRRTDEAASFANLIELRRRDAVPLLQRAARLGCSALIERLVCQGDSHKAKAILDQIEIVLPVAQKHGVDADLVFAIAEVGAIRKLAAKMAAH